jgi:hypothetical protein
MGASYPKPDDQRVNRNAPAFGWRDLPVAGRVGPVPKLPAWRKWDPATKRWWTVLWRKPQAVMWEQDGSSLVALACLWDDLVKGAAAVDRVSAEIRQHEATHGLNPKAMLQLRWRVVDGSEVDAAVAVEDSGDDEFAGLRVVG